MSAANAFVATSRFKAAISLYNAFEEEILTNVLIAVISSMIQGNESGLSEEVNESLRGMLNVSSEDYDVMISGCQYIFDQAAFFNLNPNALGAQLRENHMSEDAITVFGTIWANYKSSLIGTLRSHTFGAPKVLTDVDWRLQLTISTQDLAKTKVGNAVLSMNMQDVSTDQHNQLLLELSKPQMLKFYDRLEIIQTQLDQIAKLMVLKPDPSYKDAVSAVEIFIGMFIGSVLSTLMLVDFSVLSLNNDVFTAQFYLWKNQAAYIKVLVSVLSFTVPLSIIGTFIALFQVFTRKATLMRHILDVLNFIALMTALYLTAMYTAPAELRLHNAALKADVTEVKHIVDTVLYEMTVYLLICQVLLLAIPVLKYSDSQKNPVPMIEVAEKTIVIGKEMKDAKKDANETKDTKDTKEAKPVVAKKPVKAD